MGTLSGVGKKKKYFRFSQKIFLKCCFLKWPQICFSKTKLKSICIFSHNRSQYQRQPDVDPASQLTPWAFSFCTRANQSGNKGCLCPSWTPVWKTWPFPFEWPTKIRDCHKQGHHIGLCPCPAGIFPVQSHRPGWTLEYGSRPLKYRQRAPPSRPKCLWIDREHCRGCLWSSTTCRKSRKPERNRSRCRRSQRCHPGLRQCQ